ncbi:MAG: YbbR-like domain-containing protein [Bacteroidaceae bacterium]|nr:YbbR-like domain-containing protein [Bacteroidaceae bacterium]
MGDKKKKLSILFRNRFSKLWNKQFLIFLFFLLLSFSFWMFQALNETYERTFAVPVKLKNIPTNVVITTEPPKHINLTLSDRGVMLYHYLYGQGFRPIELDYNQYVNASGHVSFLSSELLKQFSSQMASSTKILEVKPDTVEFFYNYGLSKRVPVKVQAQINTDRLYYLSKMKLSQDSVTVYAAKNLLDTITAAYLKPIYINNLADTLSTHAEVSPIKGAKFTPSEVKISLYVDRLVEKIVQVPIKGINFPDSKVLRTFPSKVNVIFQLGMGDYRRINADNFRLVVNYEDLMLSKSNRCLLSLDTIPEGVSHVRISPEEVEYVIEELSE